MFLGLSIENLITLLILGAGGIGFLYTMRNQLTTLGERILVLEKELKRLVDVLVAQGRQEERLIAMESRVLAQNGRLDELTKRFNEKIDRI